MNDRNLAYAVLPYSKVIGQASAKMALELAYIAPRIGGVLLSGHRGTAKSTVVRAFALMMYNELPMTLPINVTEDRVIGGWDINELVGGTAKRKAGLLEQADGKILYVDEVNLLDDHIVNLILDAASTGVVTIQHEMQDETCQTHFILVGTMNPEEGGLRPQLLDRFGLMVNITSEEEQRYDILKNVLEWDEIWATQSEDSAIPGQQEDHEYQKTLLAAKDRFYHVEISTDLIQKCVLLADKFKATGHRGDCVMALAARAYAAREGSQQVTTDHLKAVAHLALQHRRSNILQSEQVDWTQEDVEIVEDCLA